MSAAEDRAIRARVENALATEMEKRGYEGDDMFCYAVGQIVISELRTADRCQANICHCSPGYQCGPLNQPHRTDYPLTPEQQRLQHGTVERS